ncbi:RNA recognition motif domain-containing protein [Roseimarinus sediminis]|uniref:RNA recognition motif domain-containing protein n=1 Tax=Roseimarinus sediminis TaxID=1610899 RepID=UPI003D1D48FA
MDIFVAKLNAETTADDLTELFSQFGTVASTKLIMDRETGMSKCYAFIEMINEMEGAAAIEQLNDTKFMGNYLVVKKSEPKPKEKRTSDRRFGAGNGGGRRQEQRRFDNRNRDGGEHRSFNRDRGNNRYDD